MGGDDLDRQAADLELQRRQRRDKKQAAWLAEHPRELVADQRLINDHHGAAADGGEVGDHPTQARGLRGTGARGIEESAADHQRRRLAPRGH
jgi:hypothetical protein